MPLSFKKRTIDKVYTKEMLDGLRESPWGSTQREQKLDLSLDKTTIKKLIIIVKKIT